MNKLAALMAVLLLSCGSDEAEVPAPWEVGENAPVENEPGDPMPDPTPNPDPSPTPTPSPNGPPTCGGASVTLLDVGPTYDVGHTPNVVGDRVFLSALVDENVDIVEWDGDRGVERFAGTSEEDLIAGVSERWLWISARSTLNRVDLQTGALEEVRSEASLPSRYDFDHYMQPRQNAVGDRFVWRSDDGVHLFDGSEVRTYEAGGPRHPWLNEEAVAWAGWTGAESTLVVQGDDGWVLPFTADEFAYASPVLAAGRVYYVDRGEVSWAAYRGAAVSSVLSDKLCGPLHSDGSTLVTACDVRPRDSYPSWGGYLELSATELWEIDAESGEATLRHTSSEDTIYAPVVNDRWIAWVEYGPVTDEQWSSTGMIKVLPRGASVPFEVAAMGQGCPTCGAYWPPPRLVLGQDTLAFNYGLDPDATTDGPRGGPIGVARLRECE